MVGLPMESFRTPLILPPAPVRVFPPSDYPWQGFSHSNLFSTFSQSSRKGRPLPESGGGCWKCLLGVRGQTSLGPFLPFAFLPGGFWCWETPREKAQKAERRWVPGDGGSGARQEYSDTSPSSYGLVLFSLHSFMVKYLWRACHIPRHFVRYTGGIDNQGKGEEVGWGEPHLSKPGGALCSQ